jgi:uncharacterized membrane protein
MNFILLIFLIIPIVYSKKDYYSYLDMKNNPEDNKPFLFVLKGIVLCLVSIYLYIDLSLDIQLFCIILILFFLGISSLYYGFKLNKTKREQVESPD